MSEQIGINVVNQCLTCIAMDERCPDCQEQFEIAQTVLAHEAVDESNLQYRKQWLVNTQPSGHDWISPQVRIITGSGPDDSWIREEFTEPATNLADRPFEPSDETMIPLVTLGQDEAICNWCNLTFLARRITCPTCQEADA
jgi:hypothetical protein